MATHINEEILDKVLKNRVLLSLYEKNLQKEIYRKIIRHKKTVRQLLITKGTSKGSLSLINKEIRKLFKDLYGIVINDIDKLQFIQTNFYKGLLTESLARVYNVKNAKNLKKVKDVIINYNGTFAHQTTSINTKQIKRVETIVKNGTIAGTSTPKMINEVIRSYAIPENQIKTLVRTTITEISSNVSDKCVLSLVKLVKRSASWATV